jgi:hypothetical protein
MDVVFILEFDVGGRGSLISLFRRIAVSRRAAAWGQSE